MASWSKFRKGLRKEDQEVFDGVFRAARLHLAENFYAMRTIPFESIMMSIIVEQAKLMRRLQETIDRITKETGKDNAAIRDKIPLQVRQAVR
jgi:hypothetical protein